MSTALKIRCCSCGNTFVLYKNTLDFSEKVKCPHCLCPMEDSNRDIMLRAMAEFDDANIDLLKYSLDRGEKLFRFDLLTVDEERGQ